MRVRSEPSHRSFPAPTLFFLLKSVSYRACSDRNSDKKRATPKRSMQGRELSPNIIRRLEDATEIRRFEDATELGIRAPGFPAEMIDDEPEEPG